MLGPILAKYPDLATKLAPVLTPLSATSRTCSTPASTCLPRSTRRSVPGREAETKLAAALAPYSQQLATAALGGCIVDVEAALVGDTAKN